MELNTAALHNQQLNFTDLVGWIHGSETKDTEDQWYHAL